MKTASLIFSQKSAHGLSRAGCGSAAGCCRSRWVSHRRPMQASRCYALQADTPNPLCWAWDEHFFIPSHALSPCLLASYTFGLQWHCRLPAQPSAGTCWGHLGSWVCLRWKQFCIEQDGDTGKHTITLASECIQSFKWVSLLPCFLGCHFSLWFSLCYSITLQNSHLSSHPYSFFGHS